jgi:hypothetical protein
LVSAAEVGFASEKKSIHAAERDTEANLKRREEFIAKIRTVAPERLIFLDESGVTTSMTRLYARSLGGQRIHESTPGGHWKIMTILGAMSLRGMVATMTIEAAKLNEYFIKIFIQVFKRSKYPPAEPVALRLLAPQRGLTATVRSKSKYKSKSLSLLSSLPQHRQFEENRLPEFSKFYCHPGRAGGTPVTVSIHRQSRWLYGCWPLKGA